MDCKKSLGFLVFLLGLTICFSGFGSAAPNLVIEKVDKGSVVISELNNPAVFDFKITNKGPRDEFEIYSLVGVSFSPKGKFTIPGANSTLSVMAYPSKDMRKKSGSYIFEYQLKGSETGIFTDTLSLKVVELKDAVEVKPQNLHYGDQTAVVAIRNLQNTHLDNLGVRLSSAFFSEIAEMSLLPFETKNLSISINSEKAKEIVAGAYVVSAEVQLESAETKIQGVMNYLEQQNTSISEEKSGVIIRTTEISKKNEGNTKVLDKIEVRKNVFTRLFTSNSLEPVKVERNGLSVNYVWENELSPAESWSLKSTTNYTLPFILVLLVALSGIIVYFYSRTNLVLNKRVSFVRTSGGHFALKVRLHLKAKNAVENIQLVDRLPMATKLYDKAGQLPHNVDSATRRLSWNIERLNSGEERIFSYIIYSDLKIVGRFELPSASASFVKDGKSEHVTSNKTFFISDVHHPA